MSKHQLLESAQKIFAFLLALVESKFRADIVPLLYDDAANQRIDAAVEAQIVQPCLEMLKHNPIQISCVHLRGMVYYLTGNCYLEWVKGGGKNAAVPPST